MQRGQTEADTTYPYDSVERAPSTRVNLVLSHIVERTHSPLVVANHVRKALTAWRVWQTAHRKEARELSLVRKLSPINWLQVSVAARRDAPVAREGERSMSAASKAAHVPVQGLAGGRSVRRDGMGRRGEAREGVVARTQTTSEVRVAQRSWLLAPLESACN